LKKTTGATKRKQLGNQEKSSATGNGGRGTERPRNLLKTGHGERGRKGKPQEGVFIKKALPKTVKTVGKGGKYVPKLHKKGLRRESLPQRKETKRTGDAGRRT